MGQGTPMLWLFVLFKLLSALHNYRKLVKEGSSGTETVWCIEVKAEMHTVEGHVTWNTNGTLNKAWWQLRKEKRRKKVTSAINLISGHFVNQCHSHLITSVIKEIMLISFDASCIMQISAKYNESRHLTSAVYSMGGSHCKGVTVDSI